jgi:hypothetical protein
MKKIIKNLAVAASAALFAFAAISCSGMYGEPEKTTTNTDNLYTLWTGSIASDDSSWPSNLVDGVKEAINTKGYARAEITLIVEPTAAGKSAGYYQYCAVQSDQTKLVGAVTASNNSGWELASGSETWTFMPTAADWSYITTTGLYISGCNYNLVGVYLSKVVPDYDSDVTTTFPYTNTSGFATGSEGSGHIIFANSTMKPLKTLFDAGTPVTLAVKYVLDTNLSAAGGTLTIKTNPTYGETVVSILNKSVTAGGTYTFDLDNETATLFATYGMIISGTKIRVTSITYSAVELNFAKFTGTIPSTAVSQTTIYSNPTYLTTDNAHTLPYVCSWGYATYSGAAVGDTVYVTVEPTSSGTAGSIGIKYAWTDETTYLTTSSTASEVYSFNVTAAALSGGFGVSGNGITITAYQVVPASD